MSGTACNSLWCIHTCTSLDKGSQCGVLCNLCRGLQTRGCTTSSWDQNIIPISRLERLTSSLLVTRSTNWAKRDMLWSSRTWIWPYPSPIHMNTKAHQFIVTRVDFYQKRYSIFRPIQSTEQIRRLKLEPNTISKDYRSTLASFASSWAIPWPTARNHVHPCMVWGPQG